MRNFLRKIFLWVGAIFWSRRFRVSSVVASSFALQAFACTYGPPDEPCHRDCYDPSWDCEPLFDAEKFSGKDYSECEQSLADSLMYILNCKDLCGSYPPELEKACNDRKPSDCSYYTLNDKQNFVHSLESECPLDHLKADSSLVGYRCADSYENVSIEEGEKRLQEYKDWLERRHSS